MESQPPFPWSTCTQPSCIPQWSGTWAWESAPQRPAWAASCLPTSFTLVSPSGQSAHGRVGVEALIGCNVGWGLLNRKTCVHTAKTGSVPGEGSYRGALWWKHSCGKQPVHKLEIDKRGRCCACFSLPRPSVRERNSPVLRNCSVFGEPVYLIGEIPSWNLKGIGIGSLKGIGRERCPLKRSDEQRASVT